MAIILTISKIDVHNNYSGATLLKWEFVDTEEDIVEYVFNIYNSLSPDEEFTKINDTPITDTQFLYPHPFINDSSVKLYFKIEVENIVTGDKELSAVTGAVFATPNDSIADTIIYQHNIMLERVLGRPPVKLLIKRRTGTRCTNCWDADLMEVTKSNCTECFSIGYKYGYMPPKDIYISFTEPGFISKFDVADVKDVQQGVTPAWSSNYPLILPGDVIIDEFNRRFIVMQVQPTTKSGLIYLRQLLQLQLLPPTDIIYKLDVENL